MSHTQRPGCQLWVSCLPPASQTFQHSPARFALRRVLLFTLKRRHVAPLHKRGCDKLSFYSYRASLVGKSQYLFYWENPKNSFRTSYFFERRPVRWEELTIYQNPQTVPIKSPKQDKSIVDCFFVLGN